MPGEPESSTLRLLRVIGSPLVNATRLRVDICESELFKLYQLAVKNKIPLLYLEEVLKKQEHLSKLKHKYAEERRRYSEFMNTIGRLAEVLESAKIEYALFKTIKPYPAVPVDVDLLTLGDDKAYQKAVEVLLKAGYPPQTPNIVNIADLADDDDYKRAAKLLTKPTYGKRHVSPTGTDFLDPKYGVDIDLQKDIAISYLIYLDKNKFGNRVAQFRVPGGKEVKTLSPKADLMSVIAHSLMEQLYLLGEFYSFLYHLSEMNEASISAFVGFAKENRLVAAVRAFATVTAELHRAAYGSIPDKLELILEKTAFEATEAKSLERAKFKMPHKYRTSTVAKVLLEKLREQRFRKSVLTQIMGMLDPRLTKLVIQQLVDKRRRETYLE